MKKTKDPAEKPLKTVKRGAENPAQEPARGTAEEPERRIYIGPSFKGMPAGMVFQGAAPPLLAKAMEADLAVRQLVVPVDKALPGKIRDTTREGTALNQFYKAAGNFLEKNRQERRK